MSNTYIVGVDVGGTNVRVGALDTAMNLSGEVLFESKAIQGPEAVQNLIDYLKTYIAELDGDVEAVSIGFPSTLNKARTTLYNTPNLEGFDDVEVKHCFQDELGVPVFIDKDATMLLHYDLYDNDIANEGVVVGIYIGTGIGNSIIIDGSPLVGKDGVACELGHVPIPGRNDPCTCGLKGCFELYAGGKGLERVCENDFPSTSIKSIFQKHSDTPQIRQYISEVADAVVLEVNLLNPDVVILGGGVLAMKDFPKSLLLEYIQKKTRRPVPVGNLHIVFSESEDPFNGAVGAALSARRQLENKHERGPVT